MAGGGIANNPNNPNNPFFGTDADPRAPRVYPQQPQMREPQRPQGQPGFQSPYANYGFDPGLQSYLDNQYRMSTMDAGVNYQYDPTNQTFTGGTMGGTYNPIPLNVMQQAAGGNRDVLNSYYQPRFPQQPGYIPPQVKPGMPQMPQPMSPQMPFPRFGGNDRRDNRDDRNEGRYNPRPQTPQQRGAFPGMPMNPAQPPQGPQQRGLGGLQIDKFRNRLGQR